jgi:hypothetical protein
MAAKARAVHPVKRRALPPHRLEINGRVIRVRYGDPTGEVLTREEWGCWVESERRIYLAPVLRQRKHEKQLWDTFGHEVLHAMGLSHGRLFDRLEESMGSLLKYMTGLKL